MASEGNQREITPALRSALGHTRDGAPLSNNRAPESDLSPWVARIWATKVDLEQGQTIECGMFADTPVLRVLFGGDWTAETVYGVGRYKSAALFFGPQTKRMAITVRGSFSTLGIALKPGSVEALGGPPLEKTLDRIIYFEDMFAEHQWWGGGSQIIEWLDPNGPPERWLRVAEKLFQKYLEIQNCPKPNPVVEAFDIAAFENPNFSIAEFAKENAIERRTLERTIKRAYGLTPRQVLRRARVMDIAANLLGVGDNTEAEELALRYYDQSHMIREFSSYFGMTPKQFASTPQPLMTLTLEARQSRRLEVLGRNRPGETPPWRK
jgi:AraC-like DNA-binding protein